MRGRRVAPVDITGNTYHRLTAIAPVGRMGGMNTVWRFQCSCGKEISVEAYPVIRNFQKSCGCYNREASAKRRKTHGMSATPEYQLWQSIARRCRTPSTKCYHNYGGRGIELRFASFKELMEELGPRPGPKYSVDRIDNNGHYEPGNVRWATPLEQGANQRTNHLITWNGKTQHMAAWERELGVHLRNRIFAYGWSIERAFLEPPTVALDDKQIQTFLERLREYHGATRVRLVMEFDDGSETINEVQE